MDFQLEGKVALVTGGAEKAGRYFARSYAEAGADIVITHCHMPKEAEETEKEIEKLGRRCLAVDADNRNIPQLRRQSKGWKNIMDVWISFCTMPVILMNSQ